MHPAEILINLHHAKQAGASNPFDTSNRFCEYTNRSCLGCPAIGTCEYVGKLNTTKAWTSNLHTYCEDFIDYTYKELLEAFPEYQI